MNRYAEILYGKVRSIHEDERDFDTWKSIFSPSAFWVDVTGLVCEVGYIVVFDSNLGLILTPPKVEEESKGAGKEPVDEDRLSIFEAVAAQEARLNELETELQEVKGGDKK
jgi:stage V sporulation protein G